MTGSNLAPLQEQRITQSGTVEPQMLLDIVEERAPKGFDRLDSVLPPDELERIVGDYKKLVTQDRETLLRLANAQ